MFWIQKNPGKGALAALGAGLLATYQPNFDGKSMGMSGETTPTETELEYVKHLATFGQSFETMEEHQKRFTEFSKKHEFIKQHNMENHKWKVGHNHMSTWTDEEFQATLGFKAGTTPLTPKPEATERRLQSMTYNPDDYIQDSEPATIDWRNQGAVASVKNQGQCGSCWTFSTAGAVTGSMVLAGNALNSFSEQQIVDCCPDGDGCNGGFPGNAMNWISQGNKLMLDSEYPYTGVQGSCQAVASEGVGKVNNVQGYGTSGVYGTDTTGSQLQNYINSGPTSIAVQANQASFQMYETGVIDENCGSDLDHAVLAVGYGGSGVDSYIIVKNSWGASWGENGYLKVHPSQCGIYKYAAQPIS